MTDLSIRKDVRNEREFDPSLNAAHIGVVAGDGVATLTGRANDCHFHCDAPPR